MKKISSSELKVTYFKVIQLSCFLLFLMIVLLSFIQQFSFLLVLMDFIFAWATLWCWGYIYSDGRGSNMGHKQLSHFCNFFFLFYFEEMALSLFLLNQSIHFLLDCIKTCCWTKNQIPFKALPSKTCTFQFHFFTLGFPQRPTARD